MSVTITTWFKARYWKLVCVLAAVPRNTHACTHTQTHTYTHIKSKALGTDEWKK
jgi:hypothetical protein